MKYIIKMVLVISLTGCASKINVGISNAGDLMNLNFDGNPHEIRKVKINVIERKRIIPIINHPSASLISNNRLTSGFENIIDDAVPERKNKIILKKAQLIIARSKADHLDMLRGAVNASYASGVLAVAVAQGNLAKYSKYADSAYMYGSTSLACHIEMEDGPRNVSINESLPFNYKTTIMYPDILEPNFSDDYVRNRVKEIVQKCSNAVTEAFE